MAQLPCIGLSYPLTKPPFEDPSLSFPFSVLVDSPKALSIGEECLIDTAEHTFGQSLRLADHDQPRWLGG